MRVSTDLRRRRRRAALVVGALVVALLPVGLAMPALASLTANEVVLVRDEYSSQGLASSIVLLDLETRRSTTATGRFIPVIPVRLLDTRTGTGAAPIPITAGALLDLPIGGNRGVPATATAAVLNLTATGVSDSTDIRAYPGSASTIPTVSNLNLTRGITRANAAIVRLGPDGGIRLRNNNGHTQLISDLAGYFIP